MKIICIAGLIGSGKNIASDHIAEKYGYKIIDYAGMLREICRKEGLEVTRDNLQNLRIKYGNTFLAEHVIKMIRKDEARRFILTPMRRSEDYEIPKKEFGKDVFLIVIATSPKIRFERLRNRGRENDPKDFKEFQRQEARENKIFNFDKTFSYADFKVKNESSIKDFCKELDKVIKEIGI